MVAQSTSQSNSDQQSSVELTDMPSMEALLTTEETKSFAVESVIQGKVAEKRDGGVLVDIGYKAEGFVPRDEFSAWNELEVGHQIDVYLEEVEDEDNMPVLSVRKAELQKLWDHLTQNHEEGGNIRGQIQRRVKGGLIVDAGVDAFLPGSQVDLGPVKNLEDYIGTETEFRILKMNPSRRNIVLSRRAILEEEREEKKKALLEELKTDEIRRGKVKNITDFGAFVDLDGMDGLLHITDMSWGRVNHPSEVVKVGEEIEVMILDVDKERERVSLGLKQKEGDPWATVEIKYPVGSRVKGRVVNVMPYGGFVELEEGVEGLVHVSEMSWTRKINRAGDVLQVGDEVETVVLNIQPEERRISLGLRQTMVNPWELIAEEFPKGTRIKGKVRNMTSYGAFVQIKDDIDGMIHVSDMSWTRKINHPRELLEKGQEIDAVILDIDPDRQRISLGMRQLTEDPWTTIEDEYQVGNLIHGTVTKLASFGAFVELDNGVDGLIHISELSDERVEKVKDVLSVGDDVTARVIRIDIEERRIGLSLKDAREEGEFVSEGSGAAAESVRGQIKPGQDLADLSNILDDAMADLDSESVSFSGTDSSKPEETETAEAEEAGETEEGEEAEEVTESASDETETEETETAEAEEAEEAEEIEEELPDTDEAEAEETEEQDKEEV